MLNFKWSRTQYGTPTLVGMVRNNTDRNYRYVQIEFNLYDDNGIQVGTAFDNVTNLEAGGIWRFEAIVSEDTATRARLVRVTGW